ncbi:hypothetical protein HYPSUDRAFT_32835 [Hypholoma sublateritium FD-334 SS-4]|uniref:Uncharacterized protein n=1 Tax=Hypholoma sublateritium (strain FD-334 SS-4) TaxID=945553 RepID=A0A0D2QCN5_HYPSF|nr:hypothetical protein HYPSUDRAFT_32835 [Hypholoma sublateritium FD-334 SS-4]
MYYSASRPRPIALRRAVRTANSVSSSSSSWPSTASARALPRGRACEAGLSAISLRLGVAPSIPIGGALDPPSDTRHTLHLASCIVVGLLVGTCFYSYCVTAFSAPVLEAWGVLCTAFRCPLGVALHCFNNLCHSGQILPEYSVFRIPLTRARYSGCLRCESRSRTAFELSLAYSACSRYSARLRAAQHPVAFIHCWFRITAECCRSDY